MNIHAPKSQINLMIEGPVYTQLSRMAAAVNLKAPDYARNLLLAAFSARMKPTGDGELDEAVAKMVGAVLVPAKDKGDTRALRDKVEELEEALRQAREAFAPTIGWPKEWGLRPSHKVLLSALFKSRGTYVAKAALFAVLTPDESEIDPKIVDVHISNMRKLLTPLDVHIETVHSQGYAMAAASKAKLSELLGEQPAPTSDFEKKWLTACKTIEGLREELKTERGRPTLEPYTGTLRAKITELEDELSTVKAMGRLLVEERDDLKTQIAAGAVTMTVSVDTESLRAKITELSAQIVAAGEDRAVAEAATKEAAKHLARISELEAELDQAVSAIETHQAGAVEAEDTIARLTRELAEAKALPPPVLKISTDELVTAIVMGWGASFDSVEMAARTGLSEASVARILNAWRNEIQARKAA